MGLGSKAMSGLAHILDVNNNNSYIALYPVKFLQARGAVHYQHQNPLDNQKSTNTINAYINIKLTKEKARLKPN